MPLYSTSPILRNKIKKIDQNIRLAFQGCVRLVEYITLPKAGQHIILRFEVLKEDLNLDDLDRSENDICAYVGDEFWCVLIGSVFAEVQPSFLVSELPLRLERLAQIMQSKPMPIASTEHALPIKNDVQHIRNLLELGEGEWIWEVEIPVGGAMHPIIRVVSEGARKGMLQIEEQVYKIESVEPSNSYLSLVKAYPHARLAHKALMHYVFECIR